MIITGLKQADVDAQNVALQIATIKTQLASLDEQVPRIVEDMIPLVSGLTINSTKQAIIINKQSLRAQLATLQG
jgi:hypothetical protein